VSGVRWLFISKDCRVFRISQPKNQEYKPIQELAGQEVLEVILYYETKNRKPFKLLTVEFDRLSLDSEGGYVVTDEARRRGIYNFLEFGLVTPEELAKRDRPTAIPVKPVTPLAREKEALYTYLRDKLPMLSQDAPFVVEMRIKSSKQIHQSNIDLIRQAKKLK
jgi:hypothetical protein